MIKKLSFKTVYRLLATFTTVSTVLLFILFTAFFDPDSGYFDTSVSATVSKIFFAISSVLCFGISLTPAFISESDAEEKLPPNSYAMTQVTAAVAIILGAAQIALTSLNVISSAPKAYQLCGLGCIAFGAYLLLARKRKFSTSSVVGLILLAISCALPIGAIIGNNSTYTRHINSVENTLTVVFAIFFMLYILYEEKFIRGTASRFYTASALLASSSGITFSVAYIGAYLFGAVHESARFVQMILILAVCAAIASGMPRVDTGTIENDSSASCTESVDSTEEK